MAFEDFASKNFLHDRKPANRKPAFSRGRNNTYRKNTNRFVEEVDDSVNKDRRKILFGILAAGVAAVVGKEALSAAREILASLDKPQPETTSDTPLKNSSEQLEQDETFSYIPEDDLTNEEMDQIKNLLDYDAPIRLDMEKYSLLERDWKNKYEDHVLYEREFKKAYAKMQKYKEELSAYFTQCGVPEEFVYLSIPESYACSIAISHKGAKGDYQFIKDTAIENGLLVDGNIDERTDTLKSGKACARFLSRLHKELGNWTLALHAYNGGFARRYTKEARAENKIPSEEGFLKYMEDRTESIRREIKAQTHTAYTVTKKDTLFGIAKKHAVDYDKLRQFNDIRDPRNLRVGQTVKIPLSSKNRETIYNKKVSGIMENINYAPKCNAVFQLIREKTSRTKNAG